jgi:hypothetical protein
MRNKVNAEGKSWQPGHVVSQVNRVALEYECHFVQNTTKQAKPEQRWSAPEGDFLKINTDGCFKKEEGTGGWGCVVRDSTGSAVGAAAGRLDHVQDAFHAEAEACSRALHLVQDWGISRVQIETDSQLLVHAIKSNSGDLGPCGGEIKKSMFLNFICNKFSFCPRSCNSIADGLAAFGAKLRDVPQVVWPGHAPDFVQISVASDIAGLCE